jgi:hypothetical protein
MYFVAVELSEMRGRSRSVAAKNKNHPKERQAVIVDEAAEEKRIPLSKREREVLTRLHLPETLAKSPIAKSKSAELFFIPVVAHALAVFGDEQKTSHWFATPLAMLRGQTPSQHLAKGGVELVERILTRIEHNIPS